MRYVLLVVSKLTNDLKVSLENNILILLKELEIIQRIVVETGNYETRDLLLNCIVEVWERL